MYKILVLGGSGLVGRALIREMNKHEDFQIYATYFKNHISGYGDKSFKLDIEDQDNIVSLLGTLKPQSIISCLRGDFNKQLILHTKVAEYLKECDGKLYFCSTTNVFDNDMSRPHYEDDLPNSCSEYGRFKIECEKRMIECLQENACVLRLPQILGVNSQRINNLLDLLSLNEEIEVYPRLLCNTITDEILAKKICYIIENNLKGIFHLAAEDIIGYKDFYVKLIKEIGYDNVKIKENFDEKGYFALLSKRNDEFPSRLRLTNEAVINYLKYSLKQ